VRATGGYVRIDDVARGRCEDDGIHLVVLVLML